jgi:hypothetical protein
MSYRPEAHWLEKYNRWQLNAYNDSGIRRTFSTNVPGRSGKRLCQEKADEWIRMGTISASDKLSTYLDNYLSFLKQYATKSDYRPRYTHVDNHIRPILGNMKLSRITEANWESVLLQAANNGLSHKYISNIRSTIIHFCKFAKKRKYLATIPELERRIQKCPERKAENTTATRYCTSLLPRSRELSFSRIRNCLPQYLPFSHVCVVRISPWRSNRNTQDRCRFQKACNYYFSSN